MTALDVASGVLVAWAGAATVEAALALRLPRRLPARPGVPVPVPVPRSVVGARPVGGRRSEALPEAVEAVAASVVAGLPPDAGLRSAAAATGEPLAGELRALADRVSAGTGLADAVDGWAATTAADGAALVGAAVNVATGAGGELDRALSGVAATLRERRALEREVRALASQARLSAAVLAVAPLGVLALTVALDADVAAYLVADPTGRACLVAGLGADWAAWRWMRRIVDAVGAGRRTPPGVATLPEVVDLLAVGAAAGLPVAAAVGAAAPRCPEPWRAALRRGLARAGGDLFTASVAGLPAEIGPEAAPLVAVLTEAADDGDRLAPGLARLAADARDLRRRTAEEEARRLPVRLLAPLVCCSLPAFVLVALVPLLAGALAGLDVPNP